MSVRVLIADDQALVRAGFRKLLESAPDIEVVGEAADGQEAVDKARRVRPSLVLMDIRMPRLDGIEATRRLASDGESMRVLILTTFGLDEYVYEALRAGASGFMLKDAPPEELLAAIQVVARGDALIAPAVTRSVIASRPLMSDRCVVLVAWTTPSGERSWVDSRVSARRRCPEMPNSNVLEFVRTMRPALMTSTTVSRTGAILPSMSGSCSVSVVVSRLSA